RALDEIAKAGTPRHAFEVAVVRLARRPPLVPVDALLDRLAALEKRTAGGGGGGGGGGARPPSPASGGRPAQGAAPVRAEAPQTFRPEPAPSAPAPTAPMAPMARATASGAAAAVAPTTSEPAGAPSSEIVVATSEQLVQPESLLTPEVVERIRGVVAVLRAQRATWGSLVEHGLVVRCDATAFEVAYEKRSFLAAQVADRGFGEAFARAAQAQLGASAKIHLCEVPPKGRSLAALATQQKNASLDAARRAAIGHPLVQEAVSIFNAEVRGVKIPGDE
ncbi:MAG: hypothetical protein ABI175_27000, partial [Polyangiales bacterium]